jgi:hypothetical protein
MPVDFKYSCARFAMLRGSFAYAAFLTGSKTSQITLSVGAERNPSTCAVSTSGNSSMSDSWIDWNPRMLEPSKPMPSVIASLSTAEAGTEVCCHVPGTSTKRKSTIFMPLRLMRSSILCAVLSRGFGGTGVRAFAFWIGAGVYFVTVG